MADDEFVQPIDRNDQDSGQNQETTQQQVERVEYNENEVEQLVVKLGKQGLSPSEIGVRLRDQYGIPSVQDTLGQNITTVLAEHDLEPEIPEDLENVVRRAVNIREHLEENSSDDNAKHQLQQVEAQIRSMAQYYKENDRLPQDWTYEPGKARLLIS